MESTLNTDRNTYSELVDKKQITEAASELLAFTFTAYAENSKKLQQTLLSLSNGELEILDSIVSSFNEAVCSKISSREKSCCFRFLSCFRSVQDKPAFPKLSEFSREITNKIKDVVRTRVRAEQKETKRSSSCNPRNLPSKNENETGCVLQ